MQTEDLQNRLADHLWSLLEAQATITNAVRVGDRNKGTASGWLREAIANLPVDRRRLEVSFARFSHSLYTTRDGFKQEATTYTASDERFDVRRMHEAVITIREELPKDADAGANELKEAVEHTLFIAGPRLGLPALIQEVTGIGGTQRQTREGEFPSPGRVTELRLQIFTYQSATALIQETP